ncbi:cob(I)yrinic acid a,c-diamide adenosyltransferase [Aliiglaciecola sp. LCG003]|uniref:cob(I)yrinic acid a,c-diamide adenosyltransferase n=1 Tax=Aliiglaciecola sp. LCG003 TaxID=3053655 RepID=UPI0025728135|nr:cob(I)yrinic acid a,c-diamide adenosyltransferase [Aliiglaciecola sp. LCG003]WJG07941.1 cob(I)yrinic acid a,c-diamide adenosyltransferase [Aliiglaciecola sp. LCG003]
MKIYTKKGDTGQTQIYADKMVRMAKSADVLDCYGTLDELNAHVGLLLANQQDPSILAQKETLLNAQKNLFQIGFAISAKTSLIEQDVQILEGAIDTMQANLPVQTHFILPGGHPVAAQAHVCRTVTRRAERRMVALLEEHPVPEICIGYLNRLSDYFFVLARSINFSHQIHEQNV